MTQARDLYQVLGVAPDASGEDIKRAYRKLARQFHPDVSQDPEADRRFKEINLAYQTLSDPHKRRQYDMFGGEGLTPDMFGFGADLSDLSDLFNAFFGGGFTRTRTRAGPPGPAAAPTSTRSSTSPSRKRPSGRSGKSRWRAGRNAPAAAATAPSRGPSPAGAPGVGERGRSPTSGGACSGR